MSALWPPCGKGEFSYITEPPSLEYQAKKRRNIAILGSTGSIGRSALKVAETAYSLKIMALAGARNTRLLAEQAKRWRPDYLAVLDFELAQDLESLLPPDYRPIIFWGQNGYATLASLPEIDCVLSAQAGSAGLTGTLAAALAGKVIALANKESLVLAGSLLRRLCKKTGASILPVDSEHYALFQCSAGRGQALKSLILTASGGPLLGRSKEEIAKATPAEALRHPTWSMGSKISIDSASLMNKGLEMIEAMHLYGCSADKIRVLVHPQSIVHSLAEFADNSQLAQMAVPDMRLALGACLLWPDDRQSFIKPLDLARTGILTFSEPDTDLFPALILARRALEHETPKAWRATGFNPACVVLNAANEAAVDLFLKEAILFGEIPERIRLAMDTLLPDLPDPGPLPEGQHLDIQVQAMSMAGAIAELDARARKLAARD